MIGRFLITFTAFVVFVGQAAAYNPQIYDCKLVNWFVMGPEGGFQMDVDQSSILRLDMAREVVRTSPDAGELPIVNFQLRGNERAMIVADGSNGLFVFHFNFATGQLVKTANTLYPGDIVGIEAAHYDCVPAAG